MNFAYSVVSSLTSRHSFLSLIFVINTPKNQYIIDMNMWRRFKETRTGIESLMLFGSPGQAGG